MKMVLLLLILPSCLCAPTFVVNVTQSSYQAEEKHNITLEWTFSTKADRSWRDLFILCSLLAPLREAVLYHVHEGLELSESQDGQFAGRVQSDKDVLREGRIRLHVSRLRTEDSGLYDCEVKTDSGSGFGRCQLNVTAADQLQTQRPTWTPEPEKLTLRNLYITLGALLFVFITVFIVTVWIFIRKVKGSKKPLQPDQMLRISEQQPLDSEGLCLLETPSSSEPKTQQSSELSAFNKFSVAEKQFSLIKAVINNVDINNSPV